MAELNERQQLLSSTSTATTTATETETEKTTTTSSTKRIKSLDFFRGFVIVNLFSKYYTCEFDVMGDWCGPDNYFIGWEQLIMPMFYLAIGFAMQLTLKKKLEKDGWKDMATKQLKRSANLFVFGLVYHGFTGFDSYYNGKESLDRHPDWWFYKWFGYKNIDLYETLVIIAVSQILIIPIIGRNFTYRFLYAILFVIFYTACFYDFWFGQVWEHVNGGSFGCFGNAIIILAGTFLDDLYDYSVKRSESHSVPVQKKRILLGVAILLVLAGTLMGVAVGMTTIKQNTSKICFDGSNRQEIPCLNKGVISKPFIKPPTPSMSMWTMSARSLSTTYILFTIGWGYFMYAFCLVISEYFERNYKLLDDFSQRCLLMYIAISAISDQVRVQLFPNDSPGWMVPIAFIFGTILTLMALRFFQNQNMNIHL